MLKKPTVILPLATALAALSVGTKDATATALEPQNTSDPEAARGTASGHPNLVVTTGSDLLGLIVTKAADGTTLAQHYSHMSHESHSSHYSHYSSGY
jgi:hypothetical protein